MNLVIVEPKDNTVLLCGRFAPLPSHDGTSEKLTATASGLNNAVTPLMCTLSVFIALVVSGERRK